jgi:hypothetical protein
MNEIGMNEILIVVGMFGLMGLLVWRLVRGGGT